MSIISRIAAWTSSSAKVTSLAQSSFRSICRTAASGCCAARTLSSARERALRSMHIPGLEEANPLTHIEALELDAVPAHLLVLGGGYIGLELAQAMRRLGSNVSIWIETTRCFTGKTPMWSLRLKRSSAMRVLRLILGARAQQVSGSSGRTSQSRMSKDGESRKLDRKSSAGCGGAYAQHCGNRTGHRRRGTDTPWVHQGRTSDSKRPQGCLGRWRSCRSTTIHAHGVR